MRFFKIILNNKSSAIIIATLFILLLIVSFEYIEVKLYVNEVIEMNAWNFAASNHGALETLEYIESQDSYNGEFDVQISEEYFKLYVEYQEICKAYRLKGRHGENLSFDNRLINIQEDYNLNQAIEIHRNIDEILSSHDLAYENLVSYMDDSKVNYNRLIVREWKAIIAELNALDFTVSN